MGLLNLHTTQSSNHQTIPATTELVSSKSASLSSSTSDASYTDEHGDSFSNEPGHIAYRQVLHDAKKIWGRPLEDMERPLKCDDAIIARATRREQEFINNPTAEVFMNLVKEFQRTMSVVGYQKYLGLDKFIIKPDSDGDVAMLLTPRNKAQEQWHRSRTEAFTTKEEHKLLKTQHREEKIKEHGKGYGGKLSNKIAFAKQKSFYAKNNYTIRGNVFKLTHLTCPKNLDEIMPRFGIRKSGYIGVRCTTFTLNAILAAMGYATMPVSFGVSKIVCDHASTAVTLTGEIITLKLIGADTKKCMVHAGLRGMQLTIQNGVPIAGDIISIGESAAFGSAAGGIVLTMMADKLLQEVSERYRSTINLEDLGDSRCLAEMNARIKYLSQFLLPYGQYLLHTERDQKVKMKIREELKDNFKILRRLEKNKVRSLYFYLLALAADKIPASHRDKIANDCKNAELEAHINTHRIVKKCLLKLRADHAAQA